MLRRVLVCVLLTAAVAAPARAAPPVVYAHRGGAALAPENTLGAFRNAEALYTQAGVDGWLEMDTQLTSDGVPVIIHDDSLDRTTDCAGKVNAKALAQIANCNAAAHFAGWGSFEPIPTAQAVFEAGLAAARPWGIMIEIKDIPGEANFDAAGTATAAKLVPVIHALGYPLGRIIVESFWPPALDAVKGLDSNIKTLLLTTSQLPSAPPGAGFTLTENATFAALRGYDISSPDVDTLDLNAVTVTYAHALGRSVVVWTVDTPSQIAAMEAAGVDGIITNDPRLLLGGSHA